MRNLFFRFLGFLVVVMLLGSCSTTRRISDNEKLLQKNEISLNRRNFDREELSNILKQRPNGRILGLPMSLYVYNWGRKNKSGFFTRIGEPPVLFDSIAAQRSLSQMLIYLESKGYFNATGELFIDSTHPKKVIARYEFQIGEPYRIGDISWDIHSPQLRNLVGINRMGTLLKSGERYDVGILDQERERLTKLFRDFGYYDFPRDLIRFEADSTVGQKRIDLKMIVIDFPVKNNDTLQFIPHQPFTINQVFVIPDFDYSKGTAAIVDTVDFMGYKILQTADPKFNERVLHDVIHITSSATYRESDVRQSYSHINSLRVFRSSEISFQRDTVAGNPFALNALVRLTPFQKRSFTTELQTLNTSGNFGISGNLGWVNRNTFRGGELLEFRLGGGVDAQANFRDDDDRVFNTTQFSAEASLTFPRFILPFSTLGVFPKSMTPTTRLSLSYSRQVRLEFDRAVFNASLRYNWRESATKNHNLNLVDLNYLNAVRVDQILLDNLLFVNNFQDNFIAAVRYSFTYNEQVYKKASHQNYLSIGVEFSGNLISVF
ncbi:MAG: hypothetical protein LAT76_11090, partial [Schleiferiaceae bacterium]|nr:hypothetical protein [Schleiferiaceae bacterium]